MATLLFMYNFKIFVVSGALSDNAVVCIFCNNVIYVWRVWWGLMGKDLDNIIWLHLFIKNISILPSKFSCLAWQ